MMETTHPPLIGLAAYSGTGKTTLLKEIIVRLKGRGIRIAVLKHAHHDFETDRPGKDSYELRKAGAHYTLINSRYRWALVAEKDQPYADSMQEMVDQIPSDKIDLILVEGYKHEAFPKIELRRINHPRPLLYPQDRSVIAIAADDPSLYENDLPQLDANDPQQLVNFILDRVSGSNLRG